MNTPLVSIVMPIYNREFLVLETIASVCKQTYSHWECIIVDDGSTDNTLNLLKQLAATETRIKPFERPFETPKGANGCRNYGLLKAQGKYTMFLDSDDLLVDTCIEKRVEKLLEEKYDMVVFSMGIFRDPKTLMIPENRMVVNESLEDTLTHFLTGKYLPWNVSRPMFQTLLIQNKVSFNEELQLFQDDEFNIKVLKLCRPKYVSIDSTDMYYRLPDKVKSEDYSTRFLSNLNVFYNSIFRYLSPLEKQKHKKGLFLKLFRFQKEYLRPDTSFKIVHDLIVLFRQELQLKKRAILILYFGAILNRFYFKKKGYDRCYKLLKRQAMHV